MCVNGGTKTAFRFAPLKGLPELECRRRRAAASSGWSRFKRGFWAMSVDWRGEKRVALTSGRHFQPQGPVDWQEEWIGEL